MSRSAVSLDQFDINNVVIEDPFIVPAGNLAGATQSKIKYNYGTEQTPNLKALNLELGQCSVPFGVRKWQDGGRNFGVSAPVGSRVREVFEQLYDKFADFVLTLKASKAHKSNFIETKPMEGKSRLTLSKFNFIGYRKTNKEDEEEDFDRDGDATIFIKLFSGVDAKGNPYGSKFLLANKAVVSWDDLERKGFECHSVIVSFPYLIGLKKRGSVKVSLNEAIITGATVGTSFNTQEKVFNEYADRADEIMAVLRGSSTSQSAAAPSKGPKLTGRSTLLDSIPEEDPVDDPVDDEEPDQEVLRPEEGRRMMKLRKQ